MFEWLLVIGGVGGRGDKEKTQDTTCSSRALGGGLKWSTETNRKSLELNRKRML